MLAKFLALCSIAGVAGFASDAAWEDLVEGMPGSVGVKADTGRECSLMELAWMAEVVYVLHYQPTIADGKGKDIVEYDCLPKLEAKGWKVEEENQQSDVDFLANTHLGKAVFVKDHLAVLALKGTSASLSDAKLDVMNIAFGQEPTAHLKAIAKVVAKYQNKGFNVIVTGHSLGGYMAEVVGTRLQISGVGFCAPGSHTVNPLGYNHGGAKHEGFQNVNFEIDPLGNMKRGIWTHPQWSVFVTDYSPKPTHSMTPMVQSMEWRGEGWTNLNVVSKCESRKHGYHTYYNQKTGAVASSTMALEPSSMIIYTVVGATVFLMV